MSPSDLGIFGVDKPVLAADVVNRGYTAPDDIVAAGCLGNCGAHGVHVLRLLHRATQGGKQRRVRGTVSCVLLCFICVMQFFSFLFGAVRELGFWGGHEQTICIYVQRETRQGQGEDCGQSRRCAPCFKRLLFALLHYCVLLLQLCFNESSTRFIDGFH